MSRENQIEEMARDLCECCDNGICYADKKPCDLKCEEYTNAQYLFAKGYRKASEVAREIFEEIEKELRSNVETIVTIKDEEEDGWYDGELNVLGMLGNYIAELKKKYTES